MYSPSFDLSWLFFVHLSMEVKEPAPSYEKKRYSIEEYLEMEEDSDIKHEYYKGEIFGMPRFKVQHNIIAGNVFGDLYNKLKGSKYRFFNSSQRIHIPAIPFLEYKNQQEVLSLKAINVSISINEIYEGVDSLIKQ